MGLATLYNYAPTAPVQITRENYNAVGGGDNIVGNIRRAFKSDADFEIWDAAVLGTQLVDGVDYELRDLDNVLTNDAGYDVYSAYKILNVAYQACNLYITYKIVMSYNDAATDNSIIPKTILTEQGDIIYASAPSTPAALHHGNAGDILQSGGHAANPTWVDPSGIGDLAQRYNYIINPDGGIAQRGNSGTAVFTSETVPANSDDTYLFDRWVHLSDGADITDVSQVASVLPGSNLCMKYEVENANKKFGFVQILESANAIKLTNKYVTLSFQAKTEAGKVINNIRAAVLSWASTADVVTSDVVNAWGNQGVTPTWAANWTAENVPANLALTNSWTQYTIHNILIDTGSMANVAVVIWVDDTDCAVNDLLYLCQIQLVISDGVNTAPPAFIPKLFHEELNACKRFYQKSYNVDVAPATATTEGEFQSTALTTYGTYDQFIPFKVELFVIPTCYTYNTVTGATGNAGTTNGCARNSTDNTNIVGVGSAYVGKNNIYFWANNTMTAGKNFAWHYTLDAEI